MESDRIRKSEKEQFGGPIDTGDDSTAVATSVVTTRLKGTEVGKSIDQDFKQIEAGFKGWMTTCCLVDPRNEIMLMRRMKMVTKMVTPSCLV